MEEVEECLGYSKGLAAYAVQLNELGRMDEMEQCLLSLKDSLPAFYGQTLKDIGRDDEFTKSMQECRDNCRNFTSYCIGLETQHNELREAGKLKKGKCTTKIVGMFGNNELREFEYEGELYNGKPHGQGFA